MRFRVVLLLSLVFLLAGCDPLASYNYDVTDVRSANKVFYGEVVGVRSVLIDGGEKQKVVASAVAGIVGAVGGSKIGGGTGSIISAAVGGGLGYLLGDEVAKRVTRQKGDEIVVKLDNGESISTVQTAGESIKVGDRVRVQINTKGDARVYKI